MTTVKVQKNQIIAKQKEKVKKWYIVQEGTVIQCNSYAKIDSWKKCGDWNF